MRIAQVSPLFERVPPPLYGGTERIVSYLTEELVRQGHDVTLFASGDSVTRARLVAPCPEALWRSGCELHDAYHQILLDRVMAMRHEFDVIHFHFDYWHLALARRCGIPYVTTLHGRLDLPDLVPLYRTFPETPVVSISDAQRAPLPWLNWQHTVYHGLPEDAFGLNEHPQDYLAFIGRASPEKGLEEAIAIALGAEVPLRIAAAVQPVNRDYFDQVIRPKLNHPLVEYVGELGGRDKEELLANARALLFPIVWPEPFGVAMIEAMACGTPVVAYRRGSVPEVVQHGVTGFVVDGVEEAASSIAGLDALDRRTVRAVFEERHSARRMASEYADVYLRLSDSTEATPTQHDVVPGMAEERMTAVQRRRRDARSMIFRRAQRAADARGRGLPHAEVLAEVPSAAIGFEDP